MTDNRNLGSPRGDRDKEPPPKKEAIPQSAFIVPLIVLTAALVYFGHTLPLGLAELLGIGLAFLAAAGAAFVYFPHKTLMAFGVFLLLQDLLVLNLENSAPGIAPFAKYIDEALVAVFLILTVAGVCSRGKTFYKTHLEIPLLAFIFFSAIGSLIAEVPPGIALAQLFLYLKGFFLFFAILQLPADQKVVRQYARFFIFIGFLVLLGGLLDLAAPLKFRTLLGHDTMIDRRYGVISVKSIFIHPGMYGWFAAFLALYCFGFYMTYNRASYLCLGLIFSVGSFFSMRRRNLAGIVGGLTAGLFRQPLSRKLRYGLVLSALACLLVILAWPKIEGLYRDLTETYVTFENPRLVARNALYLTSFTICRERFPWGVGLGRFGSWMSQVNYSPVYKKYRLNTTYGLSPRTPKYITDTFWPAILGETGVPGAACFIWICGAIVYHLCRRIKETRDPLCKAFALGTLMVFIEGLIESLAIAVFTSPPIVYFIFGSLGLCFAFNRSSSS